MPLYVLKCARCGAEHEIFRLSFRSMHDALREWGCPKCGASKYEKVPQATNWMFGEKLRGK